MALADYGFETVKAVDVSPSACKAATLQLETELKARAEKVSIVCGDFFALDEGEKRR